MLRELAREVAAISAHPVWEEKVRLWKKKNSLQKTRPLVLAGIPEEAWPELIPDGAVKIRDPFFGKIESDLRRKIYKWNNVKDDEVIAGNVYIPIVHTVTDWIEGRIRPYTGRADRSARFEPSLLKFSDLKRLKRPELTVDWAQTDADYSEAREVLGDILNVQLGEPFYASTDGAQMGWGNSLIDILCELRGLEQVYYDLVINPGFIREAMEILCQGTMSYLDAMEEQKVLRLNNCEYVNLANTPLGSNGLAITDELPGAGFDPQKVTCAHLWGYFQAQEFAPVSADMLEEHVLPYQSRIAGRFGLNCYGCCEPLDRKWDLVFRCIPRLREVSVSHAADLEVAVDKIQNRCVFSWKPNATEMIANFRETYIRKELKRVFALAGECRLVVCLRDTLSFYGESRRLSKWVDIAMEAAAESG